MPDYLDTTDAGLLAFTTNFSTLIGATPVAFGLTAADAMTYSGTQAAYAAALATSTNPATRGGASVLAKDQKKKLLIASTRRLARAIQGTLSVTDAQRFELGLTIRKTEPTPAPIPSTSPDIDIVSVVGRVVKIRLHAAGSAAKRGKPDSVYGAFVFTAVGPTAPTNTADYKFMGNTTRTTFDIEFPAAVPNGSTVWITSAWVNAKLESGAACQPVSTILQGGVSVAA